MSAGRDPEELPGIAARRSGAIPATAGALVLVVSVSGFVLSERGIGPVRTIPSWLALAGVVGLATLAVAMWLVWSERPRAATGLSVVIIGLGVPTWAAWEWMPMGLAPVLLAAAPLALAGTVHLGLGWPRRRHHAPAVPVAYALAGLGAVLIAVAYNPLADPGCVATCARVDPLAGSVITTRGVVTMTALLLAAGGLLAGWSLARDQRAPHLLRWSAGASLVLLVAGWGVHAWRWSDPVPAVAIVAPRVIASVLLAASVLATWWEIRRARLVAERLITELNDSAAVSASSLVARTVEFAMPEDGRWIGPDGRPAPPRSDDGAVVLWQGGEPALRLTPDAGPSISSFDELSPGAMMALANARLAAVTRARLIEVRESRRRIGEASDAERRRIERDLHDGAQQRLISASLHVSLASSRLPGPVAERAQAAIRQALERLRQLAHGISSTPPEDR